MVGIAPVENQLMIHACPQGLLINWTPALALPFLSTLLERFVCRQCSLAPCQLLFCHTLSTWRVKGSLACRGFQSALRFPRNTFIQNKSSPFLAGPNQLHTLSQTGGSLMFTETQATPVACRQVPLDAGTWTTEVPLSLR